MKHIIWTTDPILKISTQDCWKFLGESRGNLKIFEQFFQNYFLGNPNLPKHAYLLNGCASKTFLWKSKRCGNYRQYCHKNGVFSNIFSKIPGKWAMTYIFESRSQFCKSGWFQKCEHLHLAFLSTIFLSSYLVWGDSCLSKPTCRTFF